MKNEEIVVSRSTKERMLKNMETVLILLDNIEKTATLHGADDNWDDEVTLIQHIKNQSIAIWNNAHNVKTKIEKL